MPRRGSNIDDEEANYLLDSIHTYLPIGPNEWQLVESRHNVVYGTKERSRESLKRKFQKLYLVKPPTGGTEVPHLIKKAKEIFEEIRSKSELSTGGEESSDDDIDYDNIVVPEVAESNIENNPSGTGSNNNNDTSSNSGGIGNHFNIGINSTTTGTPLSARRTPLAWINSRRSASSSNVPVFEQYMSFMMMQQEMSREERKEEAKIRQLHHDQMMQLLMFNARTSTSQPTGTITTSSSNVGSQVSEPIILGESEIYGTSDDDFSTEGITNVNNKNDFTTEGITNNNNENIN